MPLRVARSAPSWRPVTQMPEPRTIIHDAHPGWRSESCYMCRGCGYRGIDAVMTCSTCKGNGGWWKHCSTGTLAEWPGGPLIGKDAPDVPAGDSDA